MKTIALAILSLAISASCIHAEGTPIAEFLKTRPSYKQMTDEEIAAAPNSFKPDSYLADSAYRSERGNITVTAFVRKQKVIGYDIRIEIPGGGDLPIGRAGMNEAVEKSFDPAQFSTVATAAGAGAYEWVFMNAKEYETAKSEEIEKLAKTLVP